MSIVRRLLARLPACLPARLLATGLALAAAATVAACTTPAARPSTPAPRLVETSLAPLGGGAPRSLHEVASGRPMLIDMYATWCDGCRKQIAGLEALAARLGDRAVVVGVDVGDELDVARTFATREGIAYPTFADPEFTFADAMAVSDLPHLMVVDHDGAVVHRSQKLDADTEAVIERLIAP